MSARVRFKEEQTTNQYAVSSNKGGLQEVSILGFMGMKCLTLKSELHIGVDAQKIKERERDILERQPPSSYWMNVGNEVNTGQRKGTEDKTKEKEKTERRMRRRGVGM